MPGRSPAKSDIYVTESCINDVNLSKIENIVFTSGKKVYDKVSGTIWGVPVGLITADFLDRD